MVAEWFSLRSDLAHSMGLKDDDSAGSTQDPRLRPQTLVLGDRLPKQIATIPVPTRALLLLAVLMILPRTKSLCLLSKMDM